MANDYDSTVRSFSPQPLDTQEILRKVEEVARECSPYLFPFRRIRLATPKLARETQTGRCVGRCVGN